MIRSRILGLREKIIKCSNFIILHLGEPILQNRVILDGGIFLKRYTPQLEMVEMRDILHSPPIKKSLWRQILSTSTRRLTNSGSMLGHRRRLWANIWPELVDRLVYAGMTYQIIF